MGVQACNPVLRGQGTRLPCVQTQPCQPTELQPGLHSKISSQKKKKNSGNHSKNWGERQLWLPAWHTVPFDALCPVWNFVDTVTGVDDSPCAKNHT